MSRIPLYKSTAGQRTFYFRTVKLWNSLHPALKLKTTLNDSKSCLKKNLNFLEKYLDFHFFEINFYSVISVHSFSYHFQLLTSVVYGSPLFILQTLYINPRTYTQIHTPTAVQGEGGGWNPSLEFLICRSISKRFFFQWKAFDLVNILWVVALLKACDVTNNGCHLVFYQELEMRLKSREIVVFVLYIKITPK